MSEFDDYSATSSSGSSSGGGGIIRRTSGGVSIVVRSSGKGSDASSDSSSKVFMPSASGRCTGFLDEKNLYSGTFDARYCVLENGILRRYTDSDRVNLVASTGITTTTRVELLSPQAGRSHIFAVMDSKTPDKLVLSASSEQIMDMWMASLTCSGKEEYAPTETGPVIDDDAGHRNSGVWGIRDANISPASRVISPNAIVTSSVKPHRDANITGDAARSGKTSSAPDYDDSVGHRNSELVRDPQTTTPASRLMSSNVVFTGHSVRPNFAGSHLPSPRLDGPETTAEAVCASNPRENIINISPAAPDFEDTTGHRNSGMWPAVQDATMASASRVLSPNAINAGSSVKATTSTVASHQPSPRSDAVSGSSIIGSEPAVTVAPRRSSLENATTPENAWTNWDEAIGHRNSGRVTSPIALITTSGKAIITGTGSRITTPSSLMSGTVIATSESVPTNGRGDGACRCSGYLDEKILGSGTFTGRYCVLENGSLLRYTDSDRAKLLHSSAITSTTRVETLSPQAGRTHVFAVMDSKSDLKLILSASTSEIMEMWTKAFAQASRSESAAAENGAGAGAGATTASHNTEDATARKIAAESTATAGTGSRLTTPSALCDELAKKTASDSISKDVDGSVSKDDTKKGGSEQPNSPSNGQPTTPTAGNSAVIKILPHCTGYLEKKSTGVGAFNSRYCVLENGVLSRYTDSDRYSLVGSTPINSVTRIEPLPPHGSRHYVFSITDHNSVESVLSAISAEIMEMWIANLLQTAQANVYVAPPTAIEGSHSNRRLKSPSILGMFRGSGGGGAARSSDVSARDDSVSEMEHPSHGGSTSRSTGGSQAGSGHGSGSAKGSSGHGSGRRPDAEATATCHGYLDNKSHALGTFSPRYFVLENGILLRYSDDTRVHLLKAIPITATTRVESLTAHGSRSYVFSVIDTSSTDKHILSAPTAEIMEMWITALVQASHGIHDAVRVAASSSAGASSSGAGTTTHAAHRTGDNVHSPFGGLGGLSKKLFGGGSHHSSEKPRETEDMMEQIDRKSAELADAAEEFDSSPREKYYVNDSTLYGRLRKANVANPEVHLKLNSFYMQYFAFGCDFPGFILIRVCENQRYIPFKGWNCLHLLPTDPAKLSNDHGEKFPYRYLKSTDPPLGYHWPDVPPVGNVGWSVEEDTEDGGWKYAPVFSSFGSSLPAEKSASSSSSSSSGSRGHNGSKKSALDFVRRRVWRRYAQLTAEVVNERIRSRIGGAGEDTIVEAISVLDSQYFVTTIEGGACEEGEDGSFGVTAVGVEVGVDGEDDGSGVIFQSTAAAAAVAVATEVDDHAGHTVVSVATEVVRSNRPS
jgi:hypothetical protein